MKICRIIYTYSPCLLGGADIYASKISQALAAEGDHQEVVISAHPCKRDIVETINNVKVYRFHPLNVATFHTIAKRSLLEQGIWTLLDIYNPHAYFKIRGILKNEKPDIVHIHTPADITLAAFSAAKSERLPVLVTLHDYIFLCRRLVLLHANSKLCTKENINPICLLYRAVTRAILNHNVDMVIAPSHFVLNFHKKNGFFNNCESLVLPHGIDIEEPRTIEGKCYNSTFSILYVGGLTRQKGVQILISAFRQISDADISLDIVGSGVYENELRRLADADARIKFHGKIAHQQVENFYNRAQVLVVPSVWYDVRPNVIVEAFKHGLPVIGADIGGIPELVVEGKTGFLFKAGEAQNLYCLLKQILKNPESLKPLGVTALAFVKQFEMRQYLAKLKGVYRDILSAKKD